MKFLHKGECNYNTEKVLLVHFVSMQLNFPVLSIFSCVAPLNADLMDHRMQGLAIFTSEHLYYRIYFDATFCVCRQNKRKMDNFCMYYSVFTLT